MGLMLSIMTIYKVATVFEDTECFCPQAKWTSVFADIPELLFWIILLCISLAVCLSEISYCI